ncbi:dephospho-CoA kinase [Ferruginibacter sp. SUN106]|uniref:dephospho-CoA kinase n=1 Tax=Ferruginibacter sp. SUN106 TaxID=2978348 RepID=UPI003D36085D
MIKVGITGGIGSGKSTVAKIFEVLGIPVYYADDVGKRLMNEDEELKQKIRQAFGEAAYINGQLDRKYIAGIVFNNPDRLALLNSFVHPATIDDAEKWMQQQNTSYAIKEAAIIFESGAQEYLDYVIGVYTPTPLRIQRTMQRDGITRDEVMARMNKQIDETIKMRLCDFVIKNDEQELVIPQVMALHKKLLSLS